MATHSSILACIIPWREEPCRLSMRSKRVEHNWGDLAHTRPQGRAYSTYIQSMSHEVPGWMTHKLESRLWEKYQQLQICRCTIMAENEEELESRLVKVKKQVKTGLKTQHSKNYDHDLWSHHFMANRWEKVETVAYFIFLGSKITADGDCSYEIKRHLFLGRKAVINLCAKSLSHLWLFVTPWTVAHQAPLYMGFSRQEYWSGLPSPSTEDLPDPRTKPGSPALLADSLPYELQGSS